MVCSVENLYGTFPAVVTPFSADGESVDFASFERLIAHVLDGGASGVVVCGSTGEAITLNDEEYQSVVKNVKGFVGSRGLCIAGIGASSTRRAVEMARFLDSARVDGILLVAPPYNKPPQEGIVAHFRAVHTATKLPIIAYNVPGRTSVNILPGTVARLAEERVIVGLKESSGSMDQIMDIVKLVGNSISLLSGEDSLVHATMAVGGRGVVSVTGNVIPDVISGMTTAANKGNWGDALSAQLRSLALTRLMFSETNPIPVKCALALKGVITNATLRLPLLAAQTETLEKIKAALRLFES